MRTSLKYKLPMVILLVFFLFLLLLVLYYQIFLKDNLGEDFNVFQDHLYQISEEITTRINTYYPDTDRIAEYLRMSASQKQIQITLFDLDGNQLFRVDQRKGYGLSLEMKNFTVVGRNTIYVVELVYPFSIGNLGELHSVKIIGSVALLLLALLVILLIIYLHFSLVRPFTSLNQRVETVNYRNSGTTIPEKVMVRQDELGDLARKFAAMQLRLAASYQEQAEIIASISHDLKTPLTSIIGFIERLSAKPLPEDKRNEYYRIIHQKALDINEMLAEFTDFTVCDLQDPAGEKQTVKVRDFFDAVCAEYTAELAGKGIAVRCYNEVIDGGHQFEIDTSMIRRVIANLVSNSLKYGNQFNMLSLKCIIHNDQAVFMVEDNGPGVPPDELDAIFQKFYRLDKSRSREKGGSGLGLAICQRIIQSHGGNIRAYLVEDGGLGVEFTIPLKKIS